MKIRNNEDEMKRLYGGLIGINLSDNKLPSKPTKVRWLTKDRLWNLVFWFGVTIGFSIVFLMAGVGKAPSEFSYWSSIIFWLTLIGIPCLVRYFAKTTFVKGNIFLNSEGKRINRNKDVPNLGIVVISMIMSTILLGMICDKKDFHIPNALGFFIIFTGFFGIPTLFFIFKNCPISILFNSKFWVWTLGQNASYSNCKRTPYILPSSTNSSTFRPNDLIMNPTYGGLSCNIYNKYRR